MSLDPKVLMTILGMAAGTALMRFGGYWLVSRYRIEGYLQVFLEALPGTVLMSIVAPAVFLQGGPELLAAFLTLYLAFRVPMLAAIGVGMLALLLLRMVF